MPFPEIGDVLEGRYRLGYPLGKGGMGVVWSAENIALGRRVAVKLLHRQFAEDENAVKRFRQEALAASGVGNPHIVEILDCGSAPDGSPFLVMELLEGSTLWQQMEEHQVLPLPRLADVVCQALGAAGAAHARGIVHRDIKPENIFLTRLGERQDFVKLLDFGLSLVRIGEAGSRLTKSGVLLGTPSYMAPEQVLGPREVDARADLWSFGVILFRALTGRRPFEGATAAERLAATLTALPPPLRSLRPDLDERLDAIVRRALTREVAGRFQSAAEFRAALLPYAAGLPSPYETSHAEPTVPTDAGQPAAAARTVPVASPPPLPRPHGEPNVPPHAPAAPSAMPPAVAAPRSSPGPVDSPSRSRARRSLLWLALALAGVVALGLVGLLAGRAKRSADSAERGEAAASPPVNTGAGGFPEKPPQTGVPPATPAPHPDAGPPSPQPDAGLPHPQDAGPPPQPPDAASPPPDAGPPSSPAEFEASGPGDAGRTLEPIAALLPADGGATAAGGERERYIAAMIEITCLESRSGPTDEIAVGPVLARHGLTAARFYDLARLYANDATVEEALRRGAANCPGGG